LYDLEVEEEIDDAIQSYENINIGLKRDLYESEEQEESSSILVMDFRAKESLLRINI
jgi:hypothetical protein